MQQRSSPGATLPQDAYEQERMENVRPPGWRNPQPAGRYSLVVVGGGPAGLIAASAAASMGAKVALVERALLGGGCLNVGCIPSKTIIRTSRLYAEMRNAEHYGAQLLSDGFARDGIEVRLNTEAIKVRMEDGQKFVDLVSDDYQSTVAVDAILTGTGRLPNVERLNLEAAGVDCDATTGISIDDFLQTSNPRVYAAGDACLEHKFTHTAGASARIAVHNALALGRRRLSTLTIPWCTYTDPEIAHVGLYVRDARDQDIPVRTFTIPMHDVHRAIADGEEVGFVKIHVKERTDRILGATIVARHAGEMINEITLAMVARIGLRTLARVIHAYPTQAEAIKKAAEACAHSLRMPSGPRARTNQRAN